MVKQKIYSTKKMSKGQNQETETQWHHQTRERQRTGEHNKVTHEQQDKSRTKTKPFGLTYVAGNKSTANKLKVEQHENHD